MKVLLVAEQLRRRVPGGIGTYVQGLSRGLGEVGVAVTPWATRNKDANSDPVTALGGQAEVINLPSKLLTRVWDIGFIAPPQGYDVVHATSLSVPPKGRTPMTAMVHDIAWRSFPDAFPPRGRRWHEAALRRTVKRADQFFVPSSLSADHLVRSGVEAARVHIVPEGCDHLPEPDTAGAKEMLRSHGVEGPYILTVGTLEPRKNLAALVSAYSQAKSKLPEPWPLVVVGPAGWGATFTPPEGVVAVGAATGASIAALYQGCELFVSVPLLEGYGLPVVEAMSKGAPVVASAVPSAGGATLEVDPHNVSSIADGIVQGCTDDALRAELIRRGSAHAANTTWAACARAHVEVWEAM